MSEVKRYRLHMFDRYPADGSGDRETHAEMRENARGDFAKFEDVEVIFSENKLLRHDMASYLETVAKICDMLGIDIESAKNAEGNPSDVLFDHAKKLSADFDRVTAERDAALADVDRLDNALNVTDAAAEKWLSDLTKARELFELILDDPRLVVSMSSDILVPIKSLLAGKPEPFESKVSALQQRLTAADELLDTTKAELVWQESDNAELRKRVDVLEGVISDLIAGTGSSPAANRKYGRARSVLEESRKQAEPEPHQGIPGTSFQRLNALANQGE